MPFPNTLSKLPFQNPLSQNADDPHDPGGPDDSDYPDKLITWRPFFSFLFLILVFFCWSVPLEFFRSFLDIIAIVFSSANLMKY